MAKVDVAVRSEMNPEQAWKLASDLRRFDEWMTIFGGWRGEVPDEVELGTKVTSLIKLKGFRNVIRWEVTEFDRLNRIELSGRGRGGVRIGLTMTVTDDEPGSTFHLVATLSGGLLNTRIGDLSARLLDSDVRTSVENLASLR